MYSWKDILKEKFTHFFSEPSSPSSSTSSSSSSSSSSSFPSPTSSDNDQTRSPFKDDSYLSSLLSLFFPSNESNDVEPIESLATSNLKRIRCGNSETWYVKEENGEPGSGTGTGTGTGRSTSSAEVFEDAIDLQTPKKYAPGLILDSVFISSELYQFFQSCLPNIVKGCKWVLVYSTVKHGISLRTLIRNSCDFPGPCLLITGDTEGGVFGGLVNCPLTPTSQWKYQGTYQTFVFTTLYGPPTLFRPTGANRYFYMCLNELLAFGGGGNFALRLDGDLLSGTSGPCDTFGNQCLAHHEEFELKNVELWGFTHSSRYLS